MNQNIKTSVAVVIIIIIAITVGAFVWMVQKNNPEFSPSKGQQCPAIAFECPDGTIAKTGLNCEAICSGQKPENKETACTMEAKLCPDGTYVSRSGPNCEFAACPDIVGIKDKIIITSPKPNTEISSPVKISGKAVGGWFFEGSFPVSIHDDSGKVLARGIAEFTPSYPGEEWMTENFVNFEAELSFSAPSVPIGYILFTKDNPSGRPELDESFKLPVEFGNSGDTSDWQTYRNEKFGFEFKYPRYLKYKAEESYPIVYFYNTSASEYAHLDFISDIKIIFSNEISLFYCADDSSEKSYVEINRNKFKSCVVEPDTEGGPIMRAYIPNNSNFAILFAQDTRTSNKTSQILSTFKFIN